VRTWMDGRRTGAVSTKRVEEVPRGHEPPGSSVQIRDKKICDNKRQRKQERMYRNEVDYSTLSISSWNRHAEDAVLQSPTTDAPPDAEEA
jgi:hypothetical protein